MGGASGDYGAWERGDPVPQDIRGSPPSEVHEKCQAALAVVLYRRFQRQGAKLWKGTCREPCACPLDKKQTSGGKDDRSPPAGICCRGLSQYGDTHGRKGLGEPELYRRTGGDGLGNTAKRYQDHPDLPDVLKEGKGRSDGRDGLS